MSLVIPSQLRHLIGGGLLAAFACGIGSAQAHGIWFAPRVNELAIVYGHGAEDLDVIKRKEKFGPMQGFDSKGAPVDAAFKVTDRLLLADLQNKPSFVAATMDNGLWTQGPDGKWVSKGRDEVPGHKESGRYLKYAVHIRGELSGELPVLAGQRLQIIPLVKHMPHHAGEALKVKVLFNGKPVAGARVGHDYVGDPDAKPRRTGKDGIATLKVRNQGLNVISATFDAPPDDPVKAKKTEHFATLSFILSHEPE